MKAYLVARVSTLEQSDSLPAQVYKLEQYAKQKGYHDCELFQISESAYKGNRENFKQIIDLITKSEEPCIIVFDKIDRYTRNSNSTEVILLNSLCKLGQIELHFPSDNLFINKNSSAQEHFMLNMGVSNSQYFSDSISDNVKRGNQQKWREGRWTAPAPYGYVNSRKEDGTKWVSLDPLKSRAVKKAFELYASGNFSISVIGRKLREDYALTITNSKVAIILKDPFYYGQMRVNGQLYKHHYKTIISEEQFEKVEEIRTRNNIEPVRWAGLPYPYRGLIRCANCGCRVTFEMKKQKYIYGHCTQSKGKHNAAYVNQDDITDIIADLFMQIRLPDKAYEEISQKLRTHHEAKKLEHETTLQAIESEINKYDARLERVYDDYLDGKIDETIHTKKSEEMKKARRALRNRLENIELFEESEYGTKLHLLKLARDAPKLFEKADFEQKRGLINKVLSNLLLNDDQLGSKFNYPFDLIAECNKTENWYTVVQEVGTLVQLGS